MEFTYGTLGKTALAAVIVATAASATMACSKDPKLNVQNAPQPAPATTQSAPAEPAAPAAAAAAAPSATPAGELPAGHPAVALPPGHPPASAMPGGMGPAWAPE